jgi:hypothetical protein
LRDRSSRPLSSPSQATPAICSAVESLRRQRRTGQQIAAEVGVSAAPPGRATFGAGQAMARQGASPPAAPAARRRPQARLRQGPGAQPAQGQANQGHSRHLWSIHVLVKR